MKIYLRLIILFQIVIFTKVSGQFPAQNITMLSNFDVATVPSEPTHGIRYSGVWGWHDGTSHEYAFIGATNGVFIVDVTNPTTPIQRDFLPGCVTNCVWRELKTFQNYLYMVSDDGGPNCLQIADLSYLPDSVHIVFQSDSIFRRSHTIFVDGNKLYCGYVTGGIFGGSTSMAVFSLTNPTLPFLLRKLSDDDPSIGTVHDMYVRNDTVYASSGFDGIQIYHYDTITNHFIKLASITNYPFSGYNHSNALTSDSHTLIFADEVNAGLPLKAYNITDLQNMSLESTFRSAPTSTATPHNPFMVKDHYCVVAYYQDGLQLFDVSNPANVVRIGFFDTNPTNGAGLPYPDYSGCWGAYVGLPSGFILASDMQNGMFVLDANSILATPDITSENSIVAVYPNPANDVLKINIIANTTELVMGIYNLTGTLVSTKNVTVNNSTSTIVSINVKDLTDGIYVVKISGTNFSVIQKFTKLNY
jgi:choice-of-anchor B domain-containing protein